MELRFNISNECPSSDRKWKFYSVFITSVSYRMKLISTYDGERRNVNLWPEKLFLLSFVKVWSYQVFEMIAKVVDSLPRPPVDLLRS